MEVTQLSLYLKMLENENRTTLQRQRELLADETECPAAALAGQHQVRQLTHRLDFSMMPEDLVRVHAFDWPVQFAPIMKDGGLDAVIGNPPYIACKVLRRESKYLSKHYQSEEYKIDT